MLVKLCIVCLRFITPAQGCTVLHPLSTDATLMKCQQRAMHCARHRGAAAMSQQAHHLPLPTSPTPQRPSLLATPSPPSLMLLLPRSSSNTLCSRGCFLFSSGEPQVSFELLCTMRLVLTHRPALRHLGHTCHHHHHLSPPRL